MKIKMFTGEKEAVEKEVNDFLSDSTHSLVDLKVVMYPKYYEKFSMTVVYTESISQ